MKTLFWIVLALLAVGMIGFFIKNAETFHRAEKEWQQGVEESSGDVRSQAFNRALHLLLQTTPKNAAVNAAIGKILIQFQEYPLALFYLQQALQQDPSNPTLIQQRNELLQVANFPLPSQIPERPISNALLFFCILLGVVLLSLWINYRRWELLFSAFVLALIPFLQLILYFLNPIQGITILATPLFAEAQAASPQELILAGTSVTVLDVKERGEWIKVRTPEGAFGYIPGHVIRILQ